MHDAYTAIHHPLDHVTTCVIIEAISALDAQQRKKERSRTTDAAMGFRIVAEPTAKSISLCDVHPAEIDRLKTSDRQTERLSGLGHVVIISANRMTTVDRVTVRDHVTLYT